MPKPALPSDAWVVFAGDSRTDPSGNVGPGPQGTWPYFLTQSCSYLAAPVAAGNYYNFARDGHKTTDVLGQFASGAYAVNASYQPVYFFVWVGINDILQGGVPADVYATLRLIWAAARGLGYKVIAFTVGTAAGPAPLMANMAALDQLIASDSSKYDLLVRPDAIIPIRPNADPNRNWYVDGVHGNATANMRIAAAVAAMLDP